MKDKSHYYSWECGVILLAQDLVSVSIFGINDFEFSVSHIVTLDTSFFDT